MSEVMVNRELGKRFSTQLLAPMIQGAEQFIEMWATRNGVTFERSDLTMRMISSLIIGLLVQRVLGDAVLTEAWDDLPDTLADLLMNGIETREI